MKARSTFALVLRRCIAAAAPPTLLAAIAAVAGARWLDPTPLAGVAGAAARSPWLELVALTCGAAAAIAAVRFWPLFAARSPGRDWVARLQRGPWRGAGAALGAATLAHFLLLLPCLLLLPMAVGAPAAAEVLHAPHAAAATPLLAAANPRLGFRDLPAAALAAIELRPLASMPAGALQKTRVRVLVDGEALPGDPLAFEESGQHARLEFPARRIAQLELERVDGNVPLFFPVGSLVLVEAERRSTAANALPVAFACALPTLTTLALACLCGTTAALPTVLTVVAVLQFLFVVGGVGPAATALQQLLRGQWVATSAIFATGAPSVGAGVVAMIAAMLLQRRPRR